MTVEEMDKVKLGETVEVRIYSLKTEQYEWIPVEVEILYAKIDGHHVLMGKIEGRMEVLNNELTRRINK